MTPQEDTKSTTTRVDDLTGKKFGKLTALYRVDDHVSKNKNHRVVWHCKCECGNEVDVMALNLTRSHTTSCGCARADGRKKLQRDVTGERFGHLVGIRKVESRSNQTRWLFKCDCGNEVEAFLSNVTTGKTNSCGYHCGLKAHTHDNKPRKGFRGNLVGQRFGRLLVLEQLADKNGYTQFKCKCDCGNEKIASGSNLKFGNTQSCGCLHKEAMQKSSEDLTGKRFNKLTVIGRVESRYDKAHWLCRCDCGNETVVSTSGLRSGHTQSCGCYQDETASNTHFVDLSGKDFGKLHVIERVENSATGIVRYKCKCECGNETIVMSGHLTSGAIQSCGCWKQSRLETNVIKYFQSKGFENSVDYECQKKFKDLRGIGRYPLSYDFIVYLKDGKKYLIECQGEQHYREVEFFGGKETFESQQRRDQLKKEYASKIGIELIEIPYTAKKYKDTKNLLEKYGI